MFETNNRLLCSLVIHVYVYPLAAVYRERRLRKYKNIGCAEISGAH
jgi:hypothetical protein